MLRSVKRFVFHKYFWFSAIGFVLLVFSRNLTFKVDDTPSWNSQTNYLTETDAEEQHQPKLILYWTKYFEWANFNVGFQQEPFIAGQCPIRRCLTTADRSKFNQSDAVIFHSRNLDPDDLPKYRLPHQRFVFFNFEAPPNSGLENWNQLRDFFNWTMTYRLDSDIVNREPYGLLRRLERPSTSTPVQLAGKNRSIAWFVSHCSTHSKREWFADQLSKHINVDIYGHCGQMDCDSSTCKRPSYHLLKDHYRFHLSFENSLCQDYVTEKLFRPMNYDVVPIVYGYANYSQFVPYHSYINIQDFESPVQLADYLKRLMSNDDEYLKYFQWRNQYQIIEKSYDGWCQLCADLHNETLPPKSYENILTWWMNRTCVKPPTFWGDPPMTVGLSTSNLFQILRKLIKSPL